MTETVADGAAIGGEGQFLGDGGPAKGDIGHDRLSVIHVHIGRLPPDQAEALAGRLKKLLGQVRAAVTDWKPMLARLDQAISEFRYSSRPSSVTAISKLWKSGKPRSTIRLR